MIPFADVRARADLPAMVAARVPDLRPRGGEFVGRCPFHDDRDPSFTVFQKGGEWRFHCFGCGAHGTAIDWLVQTEGLEPLEAARRLARELGIPLPKEDPEAAERARAERARAERARREPVLRALELAARYYRAALQADRPEAARARAYLALRGLGPAVVPWGLGYAPGGYGIVRWLHHQGVPQEHRVAAGITKLRDGCEVPHLRNRVVFPITDAAGRVVAFTGRALGDAQPKYLNTPETEVFKKRQVLFGLEHAQREIRRTGRALLVEGPVDAISLHLAGLGTAVAVMGSALSEEQAQLLVRHGCRDAVLVPDSDERVDPARVLRVALPAGLPVRVLRLPAGPGGEKLDPDTVVRAKRGPWGDRPGREWLAEAIEQARDAFLVLLDRVAAEAPGPQAAANAFRGVVLPLLSKIPIATRGLYLKAIEERFSVTADEVRAELAASGSTPPRPPPQGTPPPGGADPVVVELNRRHFVVSVGGQTLVGTERFDPALGRMRLDLSSFADFRNLYSNQTVEIPDPRRPNRVQTIELGKYWLQHPNRRQHAGLVFLPGKPREVDGCLNLWRGFAVEPRPGSCERYKAHVRDVICNGDDRLFWWVWRWMAHAVQRTSELPKSAIVLRGPQGVGKNAFVEPFGRLFGQHFITLSWMEHLVGRFSGHLADAIVIHANEATWGFDRQREGALKSMITDPTVTVEHKMRDLFQLPNFRRLIVSTNRSTPVARDLDDRRFLVLDVSDRHKEDTAYFRALFEEIENGGLSALLHDFLHTDLTGFVPWEVPQTTGGFDIKLATAGPVTRWWFELLQEGHNAEGEAGLPFWDETPLVEDLHTSLVRWCQLHGVRRIPTREELGRDLRRLAPHVKVFRPRSPDRRRRYRLGTLEECRRAFEVQAKAGPWLWSDETVEEGEL